MTKEKDWSYLKEEDLADSVKAISEIIGFKSTIALIKAFSEQIYLPKSMYAEHLIAKEIGFESARELSKCYGGTILTLPKRNALSKAKCRRIKKEFEQCINNFQSRTQHYIETARVESLSIARVKQIVC